MTKFEAISEEIEGLRKSWSLFYLSKDYRCSPYIYKHTGTGFAPIKHLLDEDRLSLRLIIKVYQLDLGKVNMRSELETEETQ